MANISWMPRGGAEDPDTTAPTPQVFTRTIATPPGPPWEQARAAQLEARHGAPLPVNEVVFQVRRLESWAPGRTVRFAAFYVRQQELTERFSSVIEVDGRAMAVEFRPPQDRARLHRALIYWACSAAAILVLLAAGVATSLHVRAETERQLTAAETRARSQLRDAKAALAKQDQQRRLEAARGVSEPMDRLLQDLAWTSAQRAPDARLMAIHWEHGVLAVESGADASPFPEISGVRAGGRLRSGAWLWGVQPSAARSPTLGSELPR